MVSDTDRAFLIACGIGTALILGLAGITAGYYHSRPTMVQVVDACSTACAPGSVEVAMAQTCRCQER
jgi:hypothetical protein